MAIIGIVPFSEIAKSKGQRLDASYYLNKKIRCSLCSQEFSKFDIDIADRKEKHERHHKNCRKEKRNTTEGKVVWDEGLY